METKKPWMSYSLHEESRTREKSRKLHYICKVLSEMGYSVRTYFLYNDNVEKLTDLPVDVKNDSGTIEVQKIDDAIKNEILDFLKSRNVQCYIVKDFTYSDGTEVTKFIVNAYSIKEVK